jgi:dolichol kinase
LNLFPPEEVKVSTAAALPSPSAPEIALDALESYARDLHAFLEAMPSQLERLDELGQSCRALLEKAPRSLDDPRLEAAWHRAHARLSELHAALALAMPRARLLALHQDLARTYEQWIEQLESARERYGVAGEAALESVKPLMWPRTLFHVLMGVVAAGVYQFALGTAGCMLILGVLLAVFTFLEVSRRRSPWWNDVLISALKLIARPREYHHVNSSTYYLLGLCVLVPLASKTAVIAAILVLAFADPAAAWVGKRLGTRKLYRNKSVAGSAAFFAVAIAVALPYLAAFGPGFSLARATLLAVAGALAGTLAELLSGRLDDNFTVPVVTGLALTVLGA